MLIGPTINNIIAETPDPAGGDIFFEMKTHPSLGDFGDYGLKDWDIFDGILLSVRFQHDNQAAIHGSAVMWGRALP